MLPALRNVMQTPAGSQASCAPKTSPARLAPGHLLKSFVEGDDPDKVCLNYKVHSALQSPQCLTLAPGRWRQCPAANTALSATPAPPPLLPQKLKKLIKAQKAHIDQGLESAAPAEAASGGRSGAGHLKSAGRATAAGIHHLHPLHLAACATLPRAGAQCGASSDDEDMPGAPPPRAAAAAAAVAVAAAGGEPGDASSGVAEEDREFIATLNEVGDVLDPALCRDRRVQAGATTGPASALISCDPQDLGNINAYFMEKEEDAVIRLRALEDRLAAFKPAPAGSAAAAAAAVATATPTPAGEGGGAGAADAPPAELEKLRSEVSCLARMKLLSTSQHVGQGGRLAGLLPWRHLNPQPCHHSSPKPAHDHSSNGCLLTTCCSCGPTLSTDGGLPWRAGAAAALVAGQLCSR